MTSDPKKEQLDPFGRPLSDGVGKPERVDPKDFDEIVARRNADEALGDDDVDGPDLDEPLGGLLDGEFDE